MFLNPLKGSKAQQMPGSVLFHSRHIWMTLFYHWSIKCWVPSIFCCCEDILPSKMEVRSFHSWKILHTFVCFFMLIWRTSVMSDVELCWVRSLWILPLDATQFNSTQFNSTLLTWPCLDSHIKQIHHLLRLRGSGLGFERLGGEQRTGDGFLGQGADGHS